MTRCFGFESGRAQMTTYLWLMAGYAIGLLVRLAMGWSVDLTFALWITGGYWSGYLALYLWRKRNAHRSVGSNVKP